MTAPKRLTSREAIENAGESRLPSLGPPPEGAAERSAQILASHLQRPETSTERREPAA